MEKVWLYRIIHIKNLDFILKNRIICCPGSICSDPNYIGIGDTSLIESRSNISLKLEGSNDLNEYVSFYFGPRSIMLYKILNSNDDNVIKRKPDEIIYLVTNTEKLVQMGKYYFYTDGHLNSVYTQIFDDNNFSKVDLNACKAKYWTNTEKDPDLKRRKQAEFNIHGDLPVNILDGILVYSEKIKRQVLKLLQTYNLELKVNVKPSYYYD